MVDARTDAVAPDLFGRGWTRVVGAAGRSRQLLRAAAGHSPAIFKVVRDGGCRTQRALRTQLAYLTQKSAVLVDPTGRFDGRTRLDASEVREVAERFADRWTARTAPKLGQTTHVVMAFPVGTRPRDVEAIGREVCERFFEGEGPQFDYLAAVHTDRDHPHMHVVINRRGDDGELFYFGRAHRFSYDAFREAMVHAADRWGVRLEATRRSERGHVRRARTDIEVRRGRMQDAENTPQETDRGAAQTFRQIAEASRIAGRTHLARLAERAAALLDEGAAIEADGEIYMDGNERFDDLAASFEAQIEEVEEAIRAAPAAERARMEAELSDIVASVAHLSDDPDTRRAFETRAVAQGPYARTMSEAGAAQEAQADVRTRLAEAFEGTGIEADAVAARMRIEAPSEALVERWRGEDLRAVLAEEPPEFEDTDSVEVAQVGAERAYARAVQSLREGGYLRDHLADRAEVADVLAKLRAGDLPNAFEASEMRDELDRTLDTRARDALAAGDEGAIAEASDDRLERLQIARTYLQADPATATGPAMARVTDEIAAARLARHAETDADAERGLRHA